MDGDDWSSRLGQTWTDAALPARALLDDDDRSSPGLASVQLIAGGAAADGASTQAATHPRFGDSTNRFDLMAGVASIDGPSRRPTSEADGRFGGPLDGLAQGRQVQAVFEHVEHDPEAMLARLAKGDELPPGIDASAAAALTFRIAQRFRHTGRWDLAEKTLALLTGAIRTNRLPARPSYGGCRALPPAKSCWPTGRLRGNGQRDAGWAELRRVPPIKEAEVADPGQVRQRSHARLQVRQGKAADASVTEKRPPGQEIRVPSRLSSWPARSRSIVPICLLHRPFGIRWRPPIGNWGKDAQAQRLYALDHHGVDRDAWWDCARGEMWLLDRKGPSPKPLVTCISATERPHLDGRLDEALWKKCPPIVLSSPLGDDRAWPATVMLAHDAQYLYLAIQCRQAPGARYEATSERRPRDPDLSQHDRVDIFLDLDRDYATYYHLTIDHRGWAADAICGDRSWNPKWFIAAQTSDGTWTAEAAIPLAELKATIVPGKTIWALGLQRTVPGVGFQSWTTPAGTAVVPEGFGWLGFEK